MELMSKESAYHEDNFEILNALEYTGMQAEYARARMTAGGKYKLSIQKCLIQNAPHFYENQFLKDPHKAIKLIQNIINETQKGNILGENKDSPDVEVTVTDFPKNESHYLKISEIRSQHLFNFHFFRAIIKKASPVNMQIDSITRKCPDCQSTHTQKYDEQTTPQLYAQCISCKRKMENIEIKRIPIMFLELEESSEDANKGNLARITVIIKGALTSIDITKKLIIGSSIKIAGWLDVFKKEGEKNIEKPIIRPFGLEMPDEEDDHTIITQEEKDAIFKIPQKVEQWSKNLYTAVYGEQHIKEALIVQMVGNPQSNTQNKMTRGDIHQILIGDAGTSKSTFLKLTERYAIKSRYTTGGGSSAVGITASVVKDEISGGWVAEAGAMPLANDGICMIDEIDKMTEDDIKKMHEGMEQQTITVDKGNIHISIPSRTSILGAGNPKNGRFNIHDDIYQQIELPIPFLNRCDLIWILTDEYEETRDLAIAQKIIDNITGNNNIKEPTELFKKYLHLCKKHTTTLDPNTYTEIIQWYNKTRKAVTQSGTGMRLNPRSIEAILRLTLAHARAELKPIADREDLNWAKRTFLNSIKLIAVDTVTGEIDMTKLDTGTSHNEKKVIDIIRELIESNDQCTFLDIRKGIDARVTTHEIETLLNKMRTAGEIFMPKNDLYKIIR